MKYITEESVYVGFKKDDGPEKAERLRREFYVEIDGRLTWWVMQLAKELIAKFGKGIVVTCGTRTTSENKDVQGIKDSSHLRGDALDLRSHIYTAEEIAYIVSRTKQVWGPVMHILVHNGGTGPHIHINVNWQYSLKYTA